MSCVCSLNRSYRKGHLIMLLLCQRRLGSDIDGFLGCLTLDDRRAITATP